MTVRSIELFAHLLGMMTLSVALALEWWVIELLRTSTDPRPPSFAIGVLKKSPRLTAVSVLLILCSGIPLALRVGVSSAGWVRVAFVGMALMGIVGTTALRHTIAEAKRPHGSTAGDGASQLARLASRPLVRASLRIRIAAGLAIVFIMIAKPDLIESSILIGVALLVGVAASIIGIRSSAHAPGGDDRQRSAQFAQSPLRK